MAGGGTEGSTSCRKAIAPLVVSAFHPKRSLAPREDWRSASSRSLVARQSARAHKIEHGLSSACGIGLLALTLSASALSQTIVAAQPHTSIVNGFIVTEGEIADRPYIQVGTVTAKAGKFSWVSRNPDHSDVDRKLREKAQRMGADAVIRVRYTPTGASLMSWGGIKGEGLAVRYSGPATPIPQKQAEEEEKN